jgi:hypothetical protein
MTSSETRALNQVLGRIQQAASASTDDSDYPGEWFALESNDYWDYELYNVLKKKWTSLVCPYSSRFALIYCESGIDCGVWLHHLNAADKPSDYLTGPHYVSEW